MIGGGEFWVIIDTGASFPQFPGSPGLHAVRADYSRLFRLLPTTRLAPPVETLDRYAEKYGDRLRPSGRPPPRHGQAGSELLREAGICSSGGEGD